MRWTSTEKDSRALVEELLLKLPAETERIPKLLQECLEELRRRESDAKKERAELVKEQCRQAHARAHYKFRHGREWEDPDDYKPNA